MLATVRAGRQSGLGDTRCGSFPQALSHVSLVDAAAALADAAG